MQAYICLACHREKEVGKHHTLVGQEGKCKGRQLWPAWRRSVNAPATCPPQEKEVGWQSAVQPWGRGHQRPKILLASLLQQLTDGQGPNCPPHGKGTHPRIYFCDAAIWRGSRNQPVGVCTCSSLHRLPPECWFHNISDSSGFTYT